MCAGGPNDWVYVFARQVDHWHRLLKVLGREDLIGNPNYHAPKARGERIAEINAMVTTELAGATSTRRCGSSAARCAGRRGARHDGVDERAELFERGILQTMEHPSGPFRCRPRRWRFDGRPPGSSRLASLGQPCAEVFGEWLG